MPGRKVLLYVLTPCVLPLIKIFSCPPLIGTYFIVVTSPSPHKISKSLPFDRGVLPLPVTPRQSLSSPLNRHSAFTWVPNNRENIIREELKRYFIFFSLILNSLALWVPTPFILVISKYFAVAYLPQAYVVYGFGNRGRIPNYLQTLSSNSNDSTTVSTNFLNITS